MVSLWEKKGCSSLMASRSCLHSNPGSILRSKLCMSQGLPACIIAKTSTFFNFLVYTVWLGWNPNQMHFFSHFWAALINLAPHIQLLLQIGRILKPYLCSHQDFSFSNLQWLPIKFLLTISRQEQLRLGFVSLQLIIYLSVVEVVI